MNVYEQPQATMAPEPVADLIKDLRDESVILIRQQIELAKQETLEKVSKLMRNGAYLGVGALIAYAGFIFLLYGLNFLGVDGLEAAGLSREVALWAVPLILGAVIGIIGYALIQKAISTFKHTTVVPQKTVNSIKEDKQWLANKRR